MSGERHSFVFNVGGRMLPLASGVSRARAEELAGDMTEVPQGRGYLNRIVDLSVS